MLLPSGREDFENTITPWQTDATLFLDGFRVFGEVTWLLAAIDWGKPIKEGLIQFPMFREKKMGMLRWASQPWSLMRLASLQTVEGK